MPERFKPELTRRAPSPGEPPSRYAAPDGQEDPLIELARIVSGPSGFETARSRRESEPPAGFDENLESELTSHSAPPADDYRSGLEPYGGSLDWPTETAPAERQPAQEEAEYDEFAHLNLRPASRGESRRAGGRGLAAASADAPWPPIDLDNPPAAADSRDHVAAIEHAASVVGEVGGRYGDYYADPQNDPMLIEGNTADDSYRMAADGPDADFSLGRYGEEGFDPLPEYQEEPAPKSRGIGRGVLMAGAAAAVVILGGVGAIAYMSMDSGGGGAPRVIAADNRPVKVTPAPQANNNTSTAAANNKLIYDRVDDPNGDKLKANEAPITTTPRPEQRTSEASREISRIILPDTTGAGAPSAAAGSGGAGAPATSGGAVDTTRPTPAATVDNPPIGVKKVRTVVVRPDGTIISSGQGSGGDATAATAATANSGAAGRPAAGTAAGTTGVPAAGTTAGTRSTAGPSATASTGAAGTTGTVTTPNRTTTTTVTSGQGVTTATSSPAAGTTSGNANARVAARDTGGPISLVPNAGAGSGAATGRTAAVTPGADGFVVQVTSQKSESAATAAYRDLQRRFPSLLGDKQPDMQRVDLGARGVFFRVRVGPVGTQEAAGSFCDSLKGAGADCVVVRN